MSRSIYDKLNNAIEKHIKNQKFKSLKNEPELEIPDYARLKFDKDENAIVIPLFSQFRFDSVEWHDVYQSYDVQVKFIFKIVTKNLFQELSKLCDELEIINKEEIIFELTHYNLKFNNNLPMDANEILVSETKIYTDQFQSEEESQEKNIASESHKNYTINEIENGRKPEINQDEEVGYTTIIRERIDNISFEGFDMSSYPQHFSDIQLHTRVENKTIKVICKENDKTHEYNVKISYLLMDAKNPVKIQDQYKDYIVDTVHTQIFFNNQLGQRQMIVDFNTIDYYISSYHLPIYDEYYALQPILILMLYQFSVNFFGNEINRLGMIGSSQTGYAAMAIVSTSTRVQSKYLSIVDEMQTASFQLLLVQLTEICIIQFIHKNGIRGLDAKKSLIDEQIQYISMTVQFLIFVTAQVYVAYRKQVFQLKTKIANFNSDLIVHQNEIMNQRNPNDLIEFDDTTVRKIEYSKPVEGEKVNNFVVWFKFFISIQGELVNFVRYYINKPFNYFTKFQDSQVQDQAFQKQNKYYSQKIGNKDILLLQLSDWRQPVDQEYTKQLDISINSLLRSDHQWSYQYLDQDKLYDDAIEQLKKNNIQKFTDKLIDLDKQANEIVQNRKKNKVANK